MSKKRSTLLSVIIPIVCAVAILKSHAVDNSLSDEDRRFIPMYLSGVRAPAENSTYEEELDFIISIQRSVLDIAPENNGLPFSQKREPKELYEAGAGLCYDRSRVIEKILRYSGFETRHVFLFSRNSASDMKSLTTTGVSSHAVTEVLTKRGWLVVDSNASWVSIDSNRHPIPIKRIQLAMEESVDIEWRMEIPSDIYEKPFAFVYGLYSRHGHFYPPYDFVPDIQYGEFIQNVGAAIPTVAFL
ncbi:MAG: transglutaminase domain-containing protein [Sulfurisoma sp.]|nr:transglutaminase domain-containing protein [Sulfurisoma sp.]